MKVSCGERACSLDLLFAGERIRVVGAHLDPGHYQGGGDYDKGVTDFYRIILMVLR